MDAENGAIGIRPAKNHIIVRRIESDGRAESTDFVYGKDYHHKPMTAEVVDVGTEPLDTHMQIRDGDMVVIPKYGCTKIESNCGEEYHLCNIKDVIGVL